MQRRRGVAGADASNSSINNSEISDEVEIFFENAAKNFRRSFNPSLHSA